jgi:hypothetical protein
MDLIALELRLDPAEVRRRNFIRPAEFPYKTPTGKLYDSGEYERPLARALAARFGFVDCPDGRRKLQKEPVPLLGGIAIYVALAAGLVAAGLLWPGPGKPLWELTAVVAAAAGFVCLSGAIDDIFDLRPREFGGDLVEAVTNLANEFGQNSQIATEVEIRGNGSVDLPTSMAVYNIAHESLSNIQRHSRASNVSVLLELDDGAGRLEVVDNGVGFDMGVDLGQSHRGMRNMYARARAVDAELDVESAPGAGTRLVIRFPTSVRRAAR